MNLFVEVPEHVSNVDLFMQDVLDQIEPDETMNKFYFEGEAK